MTEWALSSPPAGLAARVISVQVGVATRAVTVAAPTSAATDAIRFGSHRYLPSSDGLSQDLRQHLRNLKHRAIVDLLHGSLIPRQIPQQLLHSPADPAEVRQH